MYLVFVIIVTAILSQLVGYSAEQAYSQANITTPGSNSNMTTGIEGDNATKASVSGGIAVSDPGSKGGTGATGLGTPPKK